MEIGNSSCVVALLGFTCLEYFSSLHASSAEKRTKN
uniref:Uncharacterized protein n=1 Tax=Arundo donax TaxID=35708 RepID=A0A0A9HGU0_ARUDO